jgi:uncharacterized delta-60 repeat protein
MRHAVATLLVAAAVALPGAAGAAPGDLDPSFGNGGVVTTSFGSYSEAYALGLLPNGKIVVAGANGDFALARYLPDGAPDPVFDGDGTVTTDFGGFDGAYGLTMQPNGRIVVVGKGGTDFALARYRRDGGLDPTFDDDGKVATDLGGLGEGEIGADVVIQPDGKIVAAGTRNLNPDLGTVGDFAVVRYNPDGNLDASFGSGGVVLTELQGEAIAVALQDDGRIVVAGWTGLSGASSPDTALVRYEADGTLDASFDGDGIALLDLGDGVVDVGIDLAIQSDGKLVVAGRVDGDLLLARFNPDGSLDTRGLDPYLDAPFGSGGLVTTDFGGRDYASAVGIESGGKLVAAGATRFETDENFSDFALARYSFDGSLDQTFGSGGRVTTDISSLDVIADLAVQSDGSIVAVGWASGQFVVARYLATPCCGVPGGVPAP